MPQFVISNLWDREFILSISCAKIAIDGRAHGSGHAGNSGDFAFSRNPEAHAAMQKMPLFAGFQSSRPIVALKLQTCPEKF